MYYKYPKFVIQAWFLLSAESWNEAHEVIVKKIAPDAIINQDYEFFFSLLEDLGTIHILRKHIWGGSKMSIFAYF